MFAFFEGRENHVTLTCTASCFLFPASGTGNGNATLTAHGVRKGLDYVDQRRLEEAPSMWLRKSPLPFWVDILGWPFRRVAPTTLQVTPHPGSLTKLNKLMGLPEGSLVESCLGVLLRP